MAREVFLITKTVTQKNDIIKILGEKSLNSTNIWIQNKLMHCDGKYVCRGNSCKYETY